MNRKEMQQWLEQWPEDTEIHVGIQQEAPSYCPYGYVAFYKFVGESYEDYSYTDFSGNKFVTDNDYHYNKRILQLGSSR